MIGDKAWLEHAAQRAYESYAQSIFASQSLTPMGVERKAKDSGVPAEQYKPQPWGALSPTIKGYWRGVARAVFDTPDGETKT